MPRKYGTYRYTLGKCRHVRSVWFIVDHWVNNVVLMGKTLIWKLAKMMRFHEIIRWSHIFQYLHFILLTLYFYLWFCELCDRFDIEGDVATQLNFTSRERTQTPNLCPRHPIKMDLREVSTQIIIDENQTKYSLLQLCNSIPWFSSQGTLFIVALSLSISP